MIGVECLTDLKLIIDSYRAQAKTEGKSHNTIRITTTALKVLLKFLKMKRYPTDVTKITPEILREFIGYLQNVKAFMDHPFTGPQAKGLTGHTVNCYLRAIRAVFSRLLEDEIIKINPFDRVKVPKPPKKVIMPFDDEQLERLFGVIDTKSPIGFRDRTLIETLLDTGLRVTEMAELKLEYVNLTQRYLKVLGKGNKERLVPIGISVQRGIAKYVSRYRPKPLYPLYDTLFLSREGTPLTTNRIQSIVECYARKAGIIGVRASPHTFRHTFAVLYLRNGGDVFTLQRILGHETLDMVRNYIHLVQDDIQEAHLRCSPVDNLKAKSKHTGTKICRV